MKGDIRQRLNKERQSIIESYLAGESTCSLGRRYGCSNASVYLALRDWGVPIRQTKQVAPNYERILALHEQGLSAYRIDRELGLPKGTAEKAIRKAGFDISHRQKKREVPLVLHVDTILSRYEAGEGVHRIATDFGCQDAAIIRFLRRHGITLRSLRHYAYPVDESFFDCIDNEDKAYILGLFMADGCNQQQVPCVRISLTDRGLVHAVARCLNFKGPIKKVEGRKTNHLPQYSLLVGSRKLSDSLGRAGCVSRKTYIAKTPAEDIVSSELHRHLVRGWLDGDGTITCCKAGRWISRILGTEAVCKGLSETVNKHLGFSGCVCPVHKGPKHTTWGFAIGGREQLRAYLDWLYADAILFLQRKFDKYLAFCDQNGYTPVSTARPGV